MSARWNGHPARCALSLFFILSASNARASTALQKSSPSGVVVEAVSKESPAEKAGIQPGDLILSWSRESAPPTNPHPAGGKIESPFDLVQVENEQAPRGRVTLLGRRGQKESPWLLSPGGFGLRVRPTLSKDLRARYEEGRELVESQRVEEGTRRWRAAAAEARKARDGWLGVWFLSRTAGALVEAQMWTEADAAYREAVAQLDEPGGSVIAAQVLREWGDAFDQRSDWDGAEGCYRRALAESQKLAPKSLAAARSLLNLGHVALSRGDLTAAEEHYRGSLELREKLAPGSLDVGGSLNNLGNVAYSRGDLAAAEQYYRRALVIREKLSPGSLLFAASTNNLGLVAAKEGDLEAAEAYYRRALEIHEKLAPGRREVAVSLNNLGIVALERGDLAAAEEYYRQALTIRETLAPQSLEVAGSLNNLGVLAVDRGDLAAATEYHQRALAIRERLAPESVDVATSLDNLGLTAHNRGDLAAAEEWIRRALAIYERLAPESVDVAASLNKLGSAAHDRGDLGAAEEHLRRALAIQEKASPGSLNAGECLKLLGSVAYDRRDWGAAEEYLRHSLSVREKLAPGSTIEAESLHLLGLIYRRTGKLALAAEFLDRATTALETQQTKLGGSEEVKSSFGAQYTAYYRDRIDALIELGESAKAFHVLERSRARSLLAMLAERDLLFASDLPADIARQRKLTDTEYDRVQAEIGELNPAKDGEEIERRLGRLRELRDRREEIASRIRKTSPRFASLQYPEPLDLAHVQRALDPGTVLLSYSVDTQRTLLFVVQRPASAQAPAGSGLSVLSLPIGEKALREKIEAFRRLIERRDAAGRPVLITQAGELYDILIKAAEPLIASSERVLVSPDGPLHTLPWAALVRKGHQGEPGRAAPHLVEWRPVHVVMSATVYAELQKSRRMGSASSPVLFTAFGDPKYPTLSRDQAGQSANRELRSAVTRGFDLSRLPASREEIEGIASLYPGASVTYAGEQATEERAKSIGKDVRYLHFACHGLLDERFPLNSALALTIPERPAEGQDNGLLQAWEIFEQVRLDADLVTLSACETALGKEMGGEGLVGLTRAFQYAGARSILASLWSVSDESTTELMKRFYGYLKSGKTKDEALRAAQIDLIRAPEGTPRGRGSTASVSHPFHWAAFQLIGDWR